MTDTHAESADPGEERLPEGYPGWRRMHLLASWLVTGIGLAHLGVAAFTFDGWTARATWFVGAGLGVLVVGAMNLAHIGLGPCRMPTVRFVRIVNAIYAIFGIAALLAVPEPQAVVLVVALAAQVVAGRATMPGPG
jgi:hypothetical protein